VVRWGALLRPRSEPLLRTLRAHDVLQMGETQVQVLKEEGRPVKSQSWMWVLRAAPEDRPIVYFHHDPGRGSHVPIPLLEGYRGYLSSDIYFYALRRHPPLRTPGGFRSGALGAQGLFQVS
jgi:transposase